MLRDRTYGYGETLHIRDVYKRSSVVVARLDQAAAIDVFGVIVLADRNAAGPAGRIDGLKGGANCAVAGEGNGRWGASVVAEGSKEAAKSYLC